MEMWRSRTPFMQKRVLRNGRPATATVRFCLIGSDGDGSASWTEVKGELDVDVPGASRLTLRGLFNGNKKMAPFVQPGTELPVRLHQDNDEKLVIDWSAWERDGGLAAARARGSEDDARHANAAAHRESSTSGAAPPSATVADTGAGSGGGWQEQTIAGWRQAVATGAMSQAEFDTAMEDLRRAGSIPPDNS